MRIYAVAAAALALSGCWSGEGFYTQSESTPAIPGGKYELVDLGGLARVNDPEFYGRRLNISYGKDGRAIVENTEEGDSQESLLVKLGEQPGLYVVQADLGAPIPKIGSAVYALVNLTPEGYQIAIPRCDQKRSELWDRAIVSGLTVGKPVCKFTSRAALETAMLDYAQDPISWTEYRRVIKRRKG